MRTVWLVAFLLVGCRGSADGTDGGVVTPKAPAVDSAEDEIEPAPDAEPDAGPTATLRDLDGGPAQSPVRLCQIHSVWTPPSDFAVTAVADAFVARRGQELVAIVFPQHAPDAYARESGRFVDGQVAWDAPVMKRIDDWHAESTAHGHAGGLVIATRTLYAGVDPKTGLGRASGIQGAPGTRDTLWIAVAATDARADALLADAKEHAKMLVDHACQCGYDCLKRR